MKSKEGLTPEKLKEALAENARLREALEWVVENAGSFVGTPKGFTLIPDDTFEKCRVALQQSPVQSVLSAMPKDIQTFVEALKTTPLKNSDNT